MNNHQGEHVFIARLKEIILANISDENFGVKELAQAAGLDYFNLNRKLHSILNKNTNQYIRETRLERAKELLEHEEITASEVAYKTGFGSPAYFNRCFHEYFGYAPGEFKKKGLYEHQEHLNESLSSFKEEKNAKKHLHYKRLIREKWRSKGVIYGTSGVLILAFLLLLYFSPFFKNSRSLLITKDKSIAVLPFKNLSNDTTNYYVAEGIMVDLLNRLYEIREFRVISRTSVEQFRETNKSIPEIAKILGVNFILEGSVLHYKNKLRVTVQLIDAKHDKCILTKQYDRDFEDIFIIQSDIAKQVADELQATLTVKEKKTIEKIPTQNKEAIKFYLMGRNVYKDRIEEGSVQTVELLKSVDYYKQSVLLDPEFAMAYAGLAEAYYHLSYWGVIPRANGFLMAKENALRALELDKDLTDAHTTLGLVYTFGEWKWEEARKEFLMAIKLNPNYPFAHANYSELLNILGEDDTARDEIDIAMKLDPTLYYFYKLSNIYYFNQGKLDEAIEELNKMLIFNKITQTRYPLWQKFHIYTRLNKDSLAIDALKKIVILESPDKNYPEMIDEYFIFIWKY